MRTLLFICLTFCFTNGIFAQLDKTFFTTYKNSDKSLTYRVEPFNADTFSPEELPKISENEQFAFIYSFQLTSSDSQGGIGIFNETTKTYKLIDFDKKDGLSATFKANKGRLSLSIKISEGKNTLLLNELKTGE